jgi:uncharacterized SAM-dependent methyltransferase
LKRRDATPSPGTTSPATNRASARRLAFFPGSTIGNFDPYGALTFLQRVRRLPQPDGALLIGVDFKKDPQVLHAAYDDREGVTAAFNLSLFERLRRELGPELDLDGFHHCALYSTLHGRIEMHLVSATRARGVYPS